MISLLCFYGIMGIPVLRSDPGLPERDRICGDHRNVCGEVVYHD